MSLLMGACGDRKITPGVTELFRARVHILGREAESEVRFGPEGQIDPEACFLDVGSSSLSGAAAAKSEAVRLLKGNVSWV